MNSIRVLLVIVTCLIQFQLSTCFLSWLLREKDVSESSEEEVPLGFATSKANSPFEMQTVDEKFLAESHFINDLSPLDLCHHWVIAELTNKCSDLTEEELAKLSVQLLNCQSHAENRPVYRCTEDMKIGDCTKDMDPVTWNAYQIVSNRARAVCYATRQQHFRLKTEFTVNKLVNTAQQQLNLLRQLEDGHHHLRDVTEDTLVKVKESHDEISASQQHLLAANKNVNSYILNNIRELTREKALIVSGHKELAAMTEMLQQKLDEINQRILKEGSNQKENHDEILEGLSAIRNRAQEVTEKIDEGSRQMHNFEVKATEQYHQTLYNLEKISSTIRYLQSAIQNMKTDVQNTLDWIAGIVGGTGDKMALLITLFLHCIYLLLGAVLSSFLQTPQFSRILLLAVVPLNAWAQIHTEKSLTFLPMTMFIVLTATANWSLTNLWLVYTKYKASKHGNLHLTEPTTNQACANADGCKITDGKCLHCHDMLAPDLKKCVSLLEKLCCSGEVLKTPLALLNGKSPDINVPHNTPALAVCQLQPPINKEPDNAADASTSTPKKQHSTLPSHVSTPIRNLLDMTDWSFASSDDGYTPASELTNTLDQLTNRKSRTVRRSSTSKANRSGRRSPCQALTRTNQPCKMSSLEGSNFCYIHQVAN